MVNSAFICGSFLTKHFQVHFATLYRKFETSAFEGTVFTVKCSFILLYDTNLWESFLTFVLSLHMILFPVIHTFQQFALLAIQ
jgi:hypothetical protein